MSKNGELFIDEINEEIKLIDNTENYYISCNGNMYKKDKYEKFLKIKLNYHKNGYVYTAFNTIDGQRLTRRVHRLVAQAFLENPNNFPLVGHKNNNKTDNRVENLYWTTYSENTQKAFDDKLIINDKGYEDSQSHPVIVYDINMNEIDRVGSISMCASKYNISKSTISRQCKGQTKGKSRCGYYFKYDMSVNK